MKYYLQQRRRLRFQERLSLTSNTEEPPQQLSTPRRAVSQRFELKKTEGTLTES